MVVRWACVGMLGGVLGACEGKGPDPMGFAAVDLDRDEAVSEDELGVWWRQMGFGEGWEGDDEPGIGEDELSDALVRLWDRNGGGLDEAEWTEGIRVWFPDAKAPAFTKWDLDGDGEIDGEELKAGIRYTDLLEQWDTTGDQVLEEKELVRALRRTLDVDHDTKLTAEEWKAGIGRWGEGL